MAGVRLGNQSGCLKRVLREGELWLSRSRLQEREFQVVRLSGWRGRRVRVAAGVLAALGLGAGGVAVASGTPASADGPRDSTFMLHTAVDGNVVETQDGGTDWHVVFHNRGDLPNQDWAVYPSKERPGYFAIVNVKNNQCMSIPYENPSDGVKLIVYPCFPADQQKDHLGQLWKFTVPASGVAPGTVMVESAAGNNFCMDRTDTQDAVVWDCDKSKVNQRFYFAPAFSADGAPVPEPIHNEL